MIRRLLHSTDPTPSSIWGLTPPLLSAFIVLIVIYGFADTISTSLDFSTGHGYEGNPLAAYILHHAGLPGLYVFKLLVLTGIYALARALVIDGTPSVLTSIAAVFYLMSGLFAFVSFSNFYGYFTGTDFFQFLFYQLIFFLLSHTSS